MWLRQVALVAHKLDRLVDQLHKVLGLNVAYNDPGVAVFGLINAVMPIGGEFLEIVEPVKDDASALRYLHRRGGDAGYMVIMEAEDATAHRKRILDMGVRQIAANDGKYVFTHFHPGDFGGVLASVDSVTGAENWFDPDSDWPPAGRDWRKARNDVSSGILGVTIQSRSPAAQAKRWGELLASKVEADPRGTRVALDRGFIRFVEPIDKDGTGVIGLDIAIADPARAIAAANALKLPVEGNAVHIGGVAFDLIKSTAP